MQVLPAGSQHHQPLLTIRRGFEPLLNFEQASPTFLRPDGSKRSEIERQGLKKKIAETVDFLYVLVSRDDAMMFKRLRGDVLKDQGTSLIRLAVAVMDKSH